MTFDIGGPQDGTGQRPAHPHDCECFSCANVDPLGPSGGRYDHELNRVVWCKFCGSALDNHRLIGVESPVCPVSR